MLDAQDGLRTTLQEFEHELTDEEAENFKSTTLYDLYLLIGKLQREQAPRKDMRNMNRLAQFLRWMKLFEEEAPDEWLYQKFFFFVWGPARFMLQAASTAMVNFDKLLEAYEQLGECLSLLDSVQSSLQLDHTSMRLCALIFVDITEFNRRAVKFFKGKVWRRLFTAAWKDFKGVLSSIVLSLRRHCNLLAEQTRLASTTFPAPMFGSQDGGTNLDLMNEEHVQQQELIKRKQKDDQDIREKRWKILEWLGPSIASNEHDAALEARAMFPETGTWILNHPKFVAWRAKEIPHRSILWVHGVPGAGKTVLASIMIEDCRTRQDIQIQTAYYYCRHDNRAAHTSTAILRGLLSQMVCYNDELIPYIEQARLDNRSAVLDSEKTAKALVELVCQRGHRQFVIIDGLDECPPKERREILTFFNGCVHDIDVKRPSDPGRLRLLLVSQNEPDISEALEDATILALDDRDNAVGIARDIESYVAEMCRKIRIEFTLSENDEQLLHKRTCINAAGQFLFAKLVLENLLALGSHAAFKNEMKDENFPSGLSEAYKRIIERIKLRAGSGPYEWNRTVKLLGWMACAERPLRWHEIQAAQSIDLHHCDVRRDQRSHQHIYKICGALIREPRDNDNGPVAFIHRTAKQFITMSDQIDPFLVQCNMTALCLGYISFDSFDGDLKEDKLEESVLEGDFAFADYAVANWTRHFLHTVEDLQKLASSSIPASQSFEDALSEIREALDLMTDKYADDLEGSRVVADQDVAKYDEDLLRLLQMEDAPEVAEPSVIELAREILRSQKMKLVIPHIQVQRLKKTPDKIDLPQLESGFSRAREKLGDLSSSKALGFKQQQQLQTHYGHRRFKCTRARCYFFHEGFPDKKSLKNHLNKHDRPYQCSEEDCISKETGFKNAKDLEKHINQFHPDAEIKGRTFEVLTVPTTTRKAELPCSICGKHFTRKAILNDHVASHNGIKPHQCSRCGRAFTRKSDCNRHEKLHERDDRR